MAGGRARIARGLGLLLALAVAPAARAAFPGSNGRIVSEDVRDSCCLFTVAPGGGPAPVSGSTAAIDGAYSPDGALIAYSYGRDIWVAAPDGSRARQVTTGGHNDQYVAFSPDGRLVFRRVDASDLFVVGLDGNGLRNLTDDGALGDEYNPRGRRTAARSPTSAARPPGKALSTRSRLRAPASTR